MQHTECPSSCQSLRFNGHFPGKPGLAGVYWNKDDGSGGDNWSYKSFKASVKSSPPTNQHPVFLQAGCPSCRPNNSVKALNSVGTNFGVGVGEARPKGPRAGDGVLGEGQPAPPHQLVCLRERCKLPQRGPGQSPVRWKVFVYSVPSDCLSQHLSTCCIQFAWLGIRFFYGGYTYQYPPRVTDPLHTPASDTCESTEGKRWCGDKYKLLVNVHARS